MDRRFRRLATGTTVLTFALLLLGVYTAATGSGLACAQRWPLCDGAIFGLFPATWPSFIEWVHRLVAMVTGLAILATAAVSWRRAGPRPIRATTAVAVAFLPFQILLGAETVWTYTTLSRVAHFLTALVILGSLTVASVLAWRPTSLRRTGVVLGAGVSLTGLSYGIGPAGPFVFTPLVQIVSTGAGLGAFVLFITVALSHRTARISRAAVVAVVLVGLTLTARRLVYTDLVPVVDLAMTLVVVALGLGSFVLVRATAPARPHSTRSD